MPRRETTKNKYVLQNGKFLDFVFDFSLPNYIYIVEYKTSDGKEQLKIIIATFFNYYAQGSMIIYLLPHLILTTIIHSFKNNLSTYYVQIQVYLTFLICI